MEAFGCRGKDGCRREPLKEGARRGWWVQVDAKSGESMLFRFPAAVGLVCGV